MPSQFVQTVVGLLAVAGAVLPFSARAQEPIARPALDGVFQAFNSHPLVGLGDFHGLAEEGEFYKQLVRDPRFAAEVGNVVFEAASAGRQDLLDRYLNGEDVPHEELRKVWDDMVGAPPGSITAMYPNFLAEVRSVNLALPPQRRIRVWAGDPPVDWSTIRKRADLEPHLQRRDVHAAQVIEREILRRGRKALVIYGTLHFTASPLPSPPGLPPNPGLKLRVEQARPGAFYVIAPYNGLGSPSCSQSLEAETRWPPGSLIAPVRGTWLAARLASPECARPARVEAQPGETIPPERLAQMRAAFRRAGSGADADALLYLGPAAGLTRSPRIAPPAADTPHGREMARRRQLLMPPGPPPSAGP